MFIVATPVDNVVQQRHCCTNYNSCHRVFDLEVCWHNGQSKSLRGYSKFVWNASTEIDPCDNNVWHSSLESPKW